MDTGVIRASMSQDGVERRRDGATMLIKGIVRNRHSQPQLLRRHDMYKRS